MSANGHRLELVALEGIGAIRAGDDLAAILADALRAAGLPPRDGDVIAIAQKAVSKSENRYVALESVTPSPRAVELAARCDKDPRLVEIILAESREVLRAAPGVLVVEDVRGLVLANAGVDRSNVDQDDSGAERVLLLPADPDASAARIRVRLKTLAGVDVGVIVNDSLGRAWRLGTVGAAIGVSGLPGLLDRRGEPDLQGRRLEITEVGLADELAAAASVVMGQAAEGRPAVLIRGAAWPRRDGSARELQRPRGKDLFPVILALAGGVGGAKLAHGLARTLAPHELAIVVNTGDDFEHLGLLVCPDLDTVTYTLAGLANPATGWGLAGETWNFMAALERLGGPDWFRLGDRDLATHVERRRRRAAGEPLSAISRALCASLGVRHTIAPMSDDPVPTIVRTDDAELEFQHYFVRDRCEPVVRGFEYRGAAAARPAEALRAALASPALRGIVICPSNPWLSIGPILALPDVRAAIERCPDVIAVSPIVGGEAIKGPAAKIMRELGMDVSALGIARYYRGLAKTLVLDRADAALAPAVEAAGMRAALTDTIMRDDAGRERLARECVGLLRRAQQSEAA